MINEQTINEIALEAKILQEQNSSETLFGLLVENQKDANPQSLDIGTDLHNIITGALTYVIDRLKENRHITNALINTFIVSSVIDYLITQGIITQANISRDRFIAAVVTAIILDSAYKAWENYRSR